MFAGLHGFWAKERSLFVLLIFLSLHIFVILPLGREMTFGRIIGFVFYSFLLIAGLRYLTNSRKFPIILLVAAISLVLLGTGIFSNQIWVSTLTQSFVILYCGILAWIVLVKTFSEGPITIYRIEGSIVVYLLLGLIFAYLQNIVFLLGGQSAFNGLKSTDIREFLYFSFTTLTTVGYGDISPAVPASRSIANVESLIGQLYPAILIARLVSMEFTDRAKS